MLILGELVKFSSATGLLRQIFSIYLIKHPCTPYTDWFVKCWVCTNWTASNKITQKNIILILKLILINSVYLVHLLIKRKHLSIVHKLFPLLLISSQYLFNTPTLSFQNLPYYVFRISFGYSSHIGFPLTSQILFIYLLLSILCRWYHQLNCVCSIYFNLNCTPKSYLTFSFLSQSFFLPFLHWYRQVNWIIQNFTFYNNFTLFTVNNYYTVYSYYLQ